MSAQDARTSDGTTAGQTESVALAPAQAIARKDSRQRWWRALLRHRTGMIGAVLLLLVVAAAALAPLLAPHDPTQVHFDTPFQRPGTVGFVLGTDNLGRDVLFRMLYGARASLEVGILAVVLSTVVGTPLGLAAGYWKSANAVISRVTDVALAFPFLIIAVGLAAIRGASLSNAVLALGIAHIPQMIRVVRGETLRLKSTDFVMAAVAMDASSVRIVSRHILPNCVSAIIVQATIIMPGAVLGEAVLSFLGLGIQPPMPSLGVMLSDAQQYMSQDAWLGVFPGALIAIICLSFNLFGDGLRDVLDPASHDRK
ncbi:ABC transporter permease [Nocardioides sp. Iso805N]|uniref:ABC transporter permease n=1 Tax=Nocardioides sp. Iso805N TaxID=1283287 RepID=UPI00037B828A|nr:ABC transporter permease [Nocardioides sp. Iso805N]